jgi:hypothetical protein
MKQTVQRTQTYWERISDIKKKMARGPWRTDGWQHSRRHLVPGTNAGGISISQMLQDNARRLQDVAGPAHVLGDPRDGGAIPRSTRAASCSASVTHATSALSRRLERSTHSISSARMSRGGLRPTLPLAPPPATQGPSPC